ncbi:MAG: hypothetical protein AAF513_19230 [Pseudomonadota bacterium]
MILNPDQVKRREHMGLGCFAAGAFLVIAGLITLMLTLTISLALLTIGCALSGAGLFMLARIPDLVALYDEPL